MNRYQQRFTVERWTRVANELDGRAPTLAKRLRRRLVDKADDQVITVSWTLPSDLYQAMNLSAFASARDGEQFASLVIN